MVNALQKAEVDHEPFSHLYVEGFFPEDLYDKILKNLPDPNLYRPVNLKKWARADGTSTRDRLFLDHESYSKMPPATAQFWSGVRSVLASNEVKETLFGLLWPDLSKRFGVDRKAVCSIEAEATTVLVRDIEDYKLKPHPDGLPRIVTTQIYLPVDNTQEELGTSLYKENPWYMWPVGKKFREFKRFPFRPNSSYSFVVMTEPNRKSWHGRELMSAEHGIRNSILNTYQPPGFVFKRKHN